MGDDTPIIGNKARQTAFGAGSPLGDNTWNASSGDFLDPLHVFHDTPDDRGSKFEQTLAQKGATHSNDFGAPPTQADAGGAAITDQQNRETRIRSASTILTGGAGLLDNPNTYSASRSLLGS